jgi:cysteine-rich repeat protein
VWFGLSGEQQLIELSGTSLSGSFSLAFNGEYTADIDVTSVDSATLRAELATVSTVGTVDVQVDRTSSGLRTLVTFTMGGRPRNEGRLPLFELNTTGLAGVLGATVARSRAGANPPGYVLTEQRVVLQSNSLSTLGGSFTLTFDGQSTTELPPDAGATAVRTALQQLSSIGDVEVFLSSSSNERSWSVRFYLSGTPRHYGNVAQLQLTSTMGSAATIAVQATATGSSPFDNDTVEPPPPPPVPLTVTAPAFAAVAFVPVVHVCGDGIRTTAEACDDNNTLSGDGCAADCSFIEDGWRCVSTNVIGAGTGGLDVCLPVCGDGARRYTCQLHQ